MNWGTALNQLHKSAINRLADYMAVMAIFYAIISTSLALFILDYPKTPEAWIFWSLKLVFDGVVLPFLGLINRVNDNKAMTLTKQIYDCVNSEMELIKELIASTHTVVTSSGNCSNYKPKSKEDNKNVD